MKNHALSLVLTAALAACGASDDKAGSCNPIGTWTLTTTTTGGDCTDLGSVDTDTLVVADARDAYTAQLVGPDGPVECEGSIAFGSCSGTLACAAQAGVSLRLSLAFDGSEASGTAQLEAPGECASSGNVRASR